MVKRLVASVVAGGFEAGYLISLQLGLQAGELAPVYTISRGGSLVLVWPLSVLALGEAVNAWSIGGTVVVALGLAASGLERAVPRRAVLWALSTAFSYAPMLGVVAFRVVPRMSVVIPEIGVPAARAGEPVCN